MLFEKETLRNSIEMCPLDDDLLGIRGLLIKNADFQCIIEYPFWSQGQAGCV